MPTFKELLTPAHRGEDHRPIDVSIVIPCLDEAATLGDCLERAGGALDELRAKHGYTGEIVVADNGSSDDSRRIALSGGARVLLVAERGYGAALIAGLSAARGRYLVMGDADGSYDFLEAVSMIDSLANGYDLCMGSRFRGSIKPGAMPWKNRYIGNPLLSGVLRVLFKTRVSDAHCGLRALTRRCFERLRLSSTGMEFASEMVLKAASLGCRIAEVPVTLWPDRRGRRPHLRPWHDGWRHLRFMLMLSPMWLFFGPAAAVGGFGLVVFLALLAQPDGSMIRLGGLAFGDHWMILAAAMLTIAHQLGLFGLAASIHGVREGYRRATPRLIHLLHAARLEYMLAVSATLIGTGILIFIQIVLPWAESDFGALAATRAVVAATCLFVLGVQTAFGGFLLSIVAGNRARLHELVEAEDGDRPLASALSDS